MSGRRVIKRSIWKLLYRAGIFPSRWQLGNPFKIAELSYFLRDAKIDSHHRILDIGCGKGIQTQVLAQQALAAVGIDLSCDAIDAAESFLDLSNSARRVEFLVTDISNENSIIETKFDHVFSISVLEHVIDYEGFLKGVYRVLNSGGWIHISVDSLATIHDDSVLNRHQKEYDIKEYFSKAKIEHIFKNNGFSDISVYPIFTGPFARDEFCRRIQKGKAYGGGPIWRYRTYSKFLREDREIQGSQEGIFLIAHGRK